MLNERINAMVHNVEVMVHEELGFTVEQRNNAEVIEKLLEHKESICFIELYATDVEILFCITIDRKGVAGYRLGVNSLRGNNDMNDAKLNAMITVSEIVEELNCLKDRKLSK